MKNKTGKGCEKIRPAVGGNAHKEGDMTENEQKLISLIRNSKNPEKAILVATEIIVEYLKSIR